MFKGRFTKEGALQFGTYTRAELKKFIRENPNMPFEIVPMLPESRKQRNFFEGAICPLVAYYQYGMDFRNVTDVRRVRDWLKIEFNGELVTVGGKTTKVAMSTKRKLNQGFLERVIDWLVENYQPPHEALNPEKYKHWRDTIFPYGGADTYIEYLIETGILKKTNS